MKNKTYIKAAMAATALAGFALAAPAFAAATPAPSANAQGMGRGGVRGGGMGKGMMKPGVSGTVTAISGNSITVQNAKANATYAIDATNAKVMKAGATGTVSSIAVGDTVSAQGTLTGTSLVATNIFDGKFGAGMGGQGGMMGRGIAGTVASVSGTSLTVTSKQAPNSTAAAVAYSVDASSATVMKDNATSTLSSVAVGDTVFVQGTVTGTAVVAKTIRDGVMQKPADPTADIQGNGQPVVAGSVTSVNGNTVVITNKSNVQYTIDAQSAKVSKAGVSAATLSSVAVGDSVVVQGTVNGNAVVASSILDQAAAAPSSNGKPAAPRGFFGGIGAFFGHLFGF